MKKNIREEMETEYLKTELINDNALLLYEEQEDTIIVKMRYIDSNQIKELYITRLTKEEYTEGNRIKINEDKTALAVFKKEDNIEILVNFYDLETHNTECCDFLDCAYNLKFNNKVNDSFQLIKK